MKIRLYRVVTERDFAHNCIINSSVTNELPIYDRLREQSSHALSSNSQAGIYFSFTLELKYAIYYSHKNPDNKGIYYCEVDTESLPKNIVGFYPTLFREYWLYLFAISDEVRKGRRIKDPHLGTNRTMLGILQPSQRSVSSWCSVSKQVMIQCTDLQLHPVLDQKNDYNADILQDVYSSLLNTIPKVDKKKLISVCDIILEQLDKTGLKNRYLKEFLDGLLVRNMVEII